MHFLNAFTVMQDACYKTKEAVSQYGHMRDVLHYVLDEGKVHGSRLYQCYNRQRGKLRWGAVVRVTGVECIGLIDFCTSTYIYCMSGGLVQISEVDLPSKF